MVELHDERRKALPTIHARTVPKYGEKGSARWLASRTLLDAASCIDQSACCPSHSLPLRLQRIGTHRVTVRADDIAFRDLFEQALSRREQRLGPRNAEGLCRGVAMIEIHLVRLERPAAIHARHPAQLPQELERRALPPQHAIDLSFAITTVVIDVVGTLTRPYMHAPNMNNRWSRVNRTRATGRST